MSFLYPWVLWILLGLVVLFIFEKRQRKTPPSFRFPSISSLQKLPVSLRVRCLFIPRFLRYLVLILFIFALARPQTHSHHRKVFTRGVDIILCLDISTSMKAEDFKPQNRLEVAKKTLAEFIQSRKNDRIGIVVFARQPYLLCPLTLDYSVLLSFLDQVHFGMVQDGTAIGDALGISVGRLKDSKIKSKIIILATDGANNSGLIDPKTAANLAKTYGIRIYTVGIGKEGEIPYPVYQPFFGKRYQYIYSDLDEGLLKDIARITTGSEKYYYRAKDPHALEQIYKTISGLEKTKIEVKEYNEAGEEFPLFLIPAVFFFVLEQLLAYTVFRRIPE